MARRIKGDYSPNANFFVRKPFKAGGRRLERGERFRPERFALSERRVRQLWEWNHIAVNPEEPEQKPATESKATPEKQAEPTPEPETKPAEDLSSKTRGELVSLAKERGITYATQKSKAELLEALQ